MDELLKTEELARRIKVTNSTIVRWRRAGIIPAIRVNATTYRFEYASVVEALKHRQLIHEESRAEQIPA